MFMDVLLIFGVSMARPWSSPGRTLSPRPNCEPPPEDDASHSTYWFLVGNQGMLYIYIYVFVRVCIDRYDVGVLFPYSLLRTSN